MKFEVKGRYVEVDEDGYVYRMNISTEEKRIMAAEHIFLGLPMEDDRSVIDIYDKLTVS